YVLGLRKLGHDVFYIDDGGATPFDPIQNSKSADYSYSINYLRRHLEAFGLGERWAYMDYDENYYGLSKQQTLEVLRTSDLLVNVSGGLVFREEHLHAPKRILIDADPPYLQIHAAQGFAHSIAFLQQHTTLFTFGENVGKPRCRIPCDGFTWETTRQPVVLDMWPCVYNPTAVA